MISHKWGPYPQPAVERVGSALCVDDGVAGAGPDTGVRTRGLGNVRLPIASLSLSSPGFPGIGGPLARVWASLLVSLAPSRSSDPQPGWSPGAVVACPCPSACPVCARPPSVARAGLWAGFRAGPQPTPTPPGSKVGPGEAEEDSGHWDQSVQRCFSCACASSVLTLRWGWRARTLTRGWN